MTPKNQSDAELASPTTLINEVASDGSKNTREWTAEKRSVIELKEIQPPNSPNENEDSALQKTQGPIQYNVGHGIERSGRRCRRKTFSWILLTWQQNIACLQD